MQRVKQIAEHLGDDNEVGAAQSSSVQLSASEASVLTTSPLKTDRSALARETKQQTMNRVWRMLTAIQAGRKNFDRFITDSMRIVDASATEGMAVYEFLVQTQHTNAYGTLHGGIIASLIDICSSGAAIALADTPFGVSVELSSTYIAAAKEGEVVRVESVCHKVGKSVGFTSTTIYVGDKLIAKGNHTKFNSPPR
ncbi:HotDog domain-containing protein [Cladochytrium replicatum]|nr:HotDog domain-containing protein [Cladochytrium replicatum]